MARRSTNPNNAANDSLEESDNSDVEKCNGAKPLDEVGL